jgi:hypothetical protein
MPLSYLVEISNLSIGPFEIHEWHYLAAAKSSGLGFKEYDKQFRLKLVKNPSGNWSS